MLEKVGLGNWASVLQPVIKQFISAAEGKADKAFWQDIYKNAKQYNAFYISGWIIKFFPYIQELGETSDDYNEEGRAKTEEIFLPNEFMEGSSYLLSTLSTDNFPSGVARVNIVWNDYFKPEMETLQMEFYAGFLGIKQYRDKSLEPFISWAVCDKDAKSIHHKLPTGNILNQKHAPDFWIPYVVDSQYIVNPAVYDLKRFNNAKESLLFVGKTVSDALKKNSAFANVAYKGDTVKVVVLSDGTIDKVSLTKLQDNVQLVQYIKKTLSDLPGKWFPALIELKTLSENYEMMGIEFRTDKGKVKVNSEVRFVLH